jgi:hypothetical protein
LPALAPSAVFLIVPFLEKGVTGKYVSVTYRPMLKPQFGALISGLGNGFRRDATMTKVIVLAALAFAVASALEIGPEVAMVVQ